MTGGGTAEGPPELPPGLVLRAAERAFRERAARRLRALTCVFDSVDDGADVRVPRVLMFAAAGFDVLLTVYATPRGNMVSGAVLGARALHVAIRRPIRATIEIPLTEDGRLAPTLVPPGTGSVLVEQSANISWRSEWFTL
jgi:hypothetical protein